MTRGRQAGRQEGERRWVGLSYRHHLDIFTFLSNLQTGQVFMHLQKSLIRGDQIAKVYIYQHDKTSLTQPLSFHRSENKGTGANQTVQHSRSSHIVL